MPAGDGDADRSDTEGVDEGPNERRDVASESADDGGQRRIYPPGESPPTEVDRRRDPTADTRFPQVRSRDGDRDRTDSEAAVSGPSTDEGSPERIGDTGLPGTANGGERYTAHYVPDGINRAFGRLVESPLGVPFRPWTPRSRGLRALIVVTSAAPTLLIEVVPAIGLAYLLVWVLVWTTSPAVGPWLWGYATVGSLVYSEIDSAVTPAFGALFVLSLSYYLFVRGSSVDPYSPSTDHVTERHVGGTTDSTDSARSGHEPTAGSRRTGTAVREPLTGERKYADDERERAHRAAQRREPPVKLGDRITVPLIDVEPGDTARGEYERFQVFVDHDLPSDVRKGDVICAQVVSYATNEDGYKVGVHARYVHEGRC